MPSIPLELKALIVHELAHEADYDEKNLSAVSSVWPETISYIREHRFKNVKLCRSDSLTRLLDVIAGAPAITTVIRSIHMLAPYCFDGVPLTKTGHYTDLMDLVMAAPNLEELFLYEAKLSQIELALAAIPPSSLSSIKLNKFIIQDSSTPSLTALLDILRSFPHLTALALLDVFIMDLFKIAQYIWGLRANPSNLRAERCVMWDTHHFEAPKPVPQVTSLCIHLSSASHLMFLDLLASSKTPFPNLEEIVFVDDGLPMCRPQRLPALLDRYKTTLRILDLQGVDSRNETPVLTLPPTLEHFKFAVGNTTSANFCETLSLSSTLRNVSINLQNTFCMDRLPDLAALDKVLVDMPGLEQLDLKVWLHLKKDIEEGFSRCLGKHAEGRLRVVWHVE